ncbi:MAG: hypothetical protein A3I39_01885 [Candidatus Yanofskybacteria bacterium RIFCSPLOWO2_02_FULL_47_9b]|uniref:ComEC/Rec2-related protein domain-containing protein n=1 Tax=Candidatus Yanofskybacteria bacterium RIFCSPLOWO2_02_FULL_47_9b TaxID=1802708 RepID=A0A1F8H9R6_9BACT|nr:MAG: hypothetical protein A3I39_01885 [Candidatus Yanofskybacteria bacterium RIFCSPLOWO2_02_FULL_47_9b]
MHKAQVFGYFLTAFLVGVFAGSFVADPTRFVIALLVLAGVLFVLLGRRDRQRGILVGGCILCAALGVFRYGSANFNQSVLTQFAGVQAGGKGVPVQLVGYIDDEPSTTSSGNASIIFRAKQLIVPGQTLELNERTLIIARPDTPYSYGQELSVKGSLTLPDNFAPDFDYVAYLKNKDIRTTMLYPEFAAGEPSLSWHERLTLGLYRKIFVVKSAFEKSVSKSLSEPYASYINGILLGSRQNIPDDIKDSFNRTGATHILAISGYNITIIAQALLAGLVFFVRRRQAFWLSVGCIVLFTIMTGAGASVVRAAIMGIILMTANGYGRLYDPKNAILAAAAVMVWLNPLSLRFDIGFQLSFLAVFGLMYLYPLLDGAVRKQFRNNFAEELKETLLMTISAQVMVLPLLIYYFKQLSVVALPANLLVLPLVPFTMLFGFLTGLGGLLLRPLGLLFGFFAWLLSVYQLAIIRWLGALSWASVFVSFKWFTMFGAYALIIFGLWRWTLKSGRK